MNKAARSEKGLNTCDRWQPRCMMACVCCARMYWPEEMCKKHIAGTNASWMASADKVWQLLSVEEYAKAWPMIPITELEASAVTINGKHVLLHKRRCSAAMLAGKEPAVWCMECPAQLKWKDPVMPKAALANFNWLGRLNKHQRDLLNPEMMGHRLLLALARAVTEKVVARPDRERQRSTYSWQDQFYAKGMKGTGIVFPNASKAEHATFPPKSLGDSFVAVFCGFDDTDRRNALFEKVSAKSFKEQAKALQEQNEVYQAVEFDEKSVDAWPKDGTAPKVLLECCVQMPGPINAMMQQEY